MSRLRSWVRGALRRILRPGRAAPTGALPPRDLSGRPASASPDPRGDPDDEADDEPDAEPDLEVELPIPGSLLLDIREPGELAYGVAEGALLLPMNLVPHHLAELPRDRPITIYCAAGSRSWGVAHWLREQGFPQAWSLVGGVGVFNAVGVPVRPPPGVVPGTRVRVPATARAGGAAVGAECVGEVIQQLGDVLQVVIHDAQGFVVRVDVPVERPPAASGGGPRVPHATT